MLENNNLINELENKKEKSVESIEAVAYCRADKNKDLMNVLALENQKNTIREYADNNNIKIVEWYIDDGYNGVNDKRPAFQRMFEDLNYAKCNHCKNVKLVLVHKVDRFARNLEIFIPYSVKLKLCDVDLRIINIADCNVIESRFMQHILVAISEHYKKDSEFDKNEGVQL